MPRDWPGSASKTTVTLWSPISKNLEESHLAEIKELMGGEPGDLLMFLADTWEVTCKGLAGLRKRLANELGLIDPNELNCSWVTEFPMFERDETGRWNAMHHPFTAPLASDLPKLAEDPRSLPRSSLRPGHQRQRGRRRDDPNSRSEDSITSLRLAGHRRSRPPKIVSVSCSTP